MSLTMRGEVKQPPLGKAFKKLEVKAVT